MRFLAAMAAYCLLLLASIWLIGAHPHAVWRIPVAISPAVPLAFALWAVVRFFGQLDELQRRIQLEALAVAFAATALITIGYGLLENVGLPTLSWAWVTPLMIALWGVATAVASRRYR